MASQKSAIVKFVLLQSLVAFVGFWGLSGVVQEYLLHSELMDVYELNSTRINSQLIQFQQQFPEVKDEGLRNTLQEVCDTLPCNIESMEIEEVVQEEQTVTEMRIVGLSNPIDIPIFLEAIHRLPHEWKLMGLEIQGFEKPFRFNLRVFQVQRHSKTIEWNPLARFLFIDAEDQRNIETLLQWQSYKQYFEHQNGERANVHSSWALLYQNIARPLWVMRSQSGKIMYTPESGVQVKLYGVEEGE